MVYKILICLKYKNGKMLLNLFIVTILKHMKNLMNCSIPFGQMKEEKKPGIAETLDWAAAISGLGLKDLSENHEILHSTLVCLLKTEADKAIISVETSQKLAKV